MGLNLRKIGDTIGNVVSGVERQVNPFDAGLSYKTKVAAPQNAQQGVAQQVFNYVKPVIQLPIQASENFSNTFANVGNRLAGEQNQTIQQNMGTDALNKKILAFSGATGKNAQLAGDAAQIALAVAAPAEGKIIEGGVARALPGVAKTVLPRVASNAAIAGEFNATSAAGNGATLPQVFKAGGQGIAVGGLFPVAGEAARGTVKLAQNRVPLNEVGAVGEDLNKPKVSLKQPNLNKGAFSKADQAYLTNLSAEDKANLNPKTQMALAELEGKNGATETPLAPQAVNTAKNPYKSLLTDVQPGDYKHAVQNSQLVSRPIETAQNVWASSMKRLTPDERTNFWRAVENPKGNYSPQLQDAIQQWRNVDDKVHGDSQALGGNTNYLTNHNLHPWQLPEEYTNHIINGNSPSKFTGLNNISRKYLTIAEGEANGLKLGDDPVGEGTRYLRANATILRKEALKQGLARADSGQEAQPYTLDLGGGHTVRLSKEGMSASKGVQIKPPSTNVVAKSLRTTNATLKSTVLSLGQFHTINIGALRAAPTLVAEGHPVAAAKGIYGMFRGAFGTEYADRVIGKALADGTVDKAAQIGMPYGGSSYDVSGTFLKHGIGNRTVFGKQIPVMHDQVARSIISDLEKKGVPLDSPAARDAGLAGANMMGELNKELENISPRAQQAMTDTMLAGQFTPSKFLQMKRAVSKGGVGGSYARRNVLANVAATTAIIAGIGYATKQKSDDLKDLLLRALIDPAAPTPLKDSKGNTVKLKLPGTDTSDVAKLLGIKLVRNSDGHLGISWDAGNVPSTVSDFGRARLSPLLSDGLKVITNSTYASKPLYDPNALAGTKAIQGATSLITGSLPIGLQGAAMTKPIESHLPQSAQDVLNAQKPGSSPLLKSIGSSFGITPSTDTTTGKGLESSNYFSALDATKKGLNDHEKAALELYAGSKKNPVTGKYDVMPNANDTQAKARTLLDQPKVIDRLISMNAQLTKQGQKVDPLWSLSKDQVTKVLQYQAMPPGGPDRTHWQTLNGSWYNPLAQKRSDFFRSLPAGDPNKPQAPIQYPDASPAVQAAQNQFFNIADPTQRAQFLQAHPEVQQQLDAQVDYTNQMREATGYSALDKFPAASPGVQKIIDTYNAVPTGGGKKGGNLYRSQWITAHPDEYKAMSDYYTQSSLYSLDKEAGQAQFADTGPSQKLLKDAYDLGKYDIVKNADGTYSLGSSYGSSNSAGSGYYGYSRYSGGKYISRTAAELQNPYFNALDIGAGGKPDIGKASKPKVTKAVKFSPKKAGFQPKVATKPKVTLKKVRA